MKLEDSTPTAMTPTNSSANFLISKPSVSSQSSGFSRQSSTGSSIQRQKKQYLVQQRRQNAKTSNDFSMHTSATTKPLVTHAINSFFQATKVMEDEIMLPSKLKDMAVDEVVLDSTAQPENWHELYTFVRDIRNKLKCSRPFVDDDEEISQEPTKDANEDEGILLVTSDNINHQHSSSSSTVSSDELEQSTNSSVAASFTTIKDELKYHYFGLIASLDTMTSMANRVTEKYREDSTFKT